jgi:hypothetical protein
MVEQSFLKRWVVGPSPTWTSRGNMIDLYFTIYFCMMPVIIAIGAVVAGYQKASGKIKEAESIMVPAFWLAATWPGVLALACAMAPFVALYHMGRFLATRK